MCLSNLCQVAHWTVVPLIPSTQGASMGFCQTTLCMQLHKADPKKIPNFIGATLPRKDQGDRNYYCLTMLALFKPWRKGTDLKADASTSWHEAFEQHSFSEEHITLIHNFHIKYECLDARDDYRAQLAKKGPGLFESS